MRPRRTHGQSRRTLAYSSWAAAKQRCFNLKNPAYHYYGGRGIAMCDRWRDSFEAFYADMGERPKGKTLERLDRNRGYEPGNCVWATHREQMNNTSQVRPLTINGETYSLAVWARKFGISRGCLMERVRNGWPSDQLGAPASVQNGWRMISFNGITLPIRQWAAKVGLTERSLGHRLNRGWTVERALTEPAHR